MLLLRGYSLIAWLGVCTFSMKVCNFMSVSVVQFLCFLYVFKFV